MDRRDRYLRKTYNISSEEYESILAAQLNRCYICKKPPTGMRLSVDHDHKTGLVRGLLCWRCNSLLAKGLDDPVVFARAALYLREPPAGIALGEDRFGMKGGRRRRRKIHTGTTKV